MLQTISIKNFRLFQHIKVTHLNRINLVVGKNNSGKSAFLEALELFASNASPAVILDLIESRQESWASNSKSLPRNSFGYSVRHLFFGHLLPEFDQEGIRIGEIESKNQIHLTTGAYIREKQPDGTINRIRVSTNSITPDTDISQVDVALVSEDDKRTRKILSLEDDVRRPYRPSYYEQRLASDFRYPWQVVPTENMSNRMIATLWDQTSLTEQEAEVISALRLIDPRVSGVAFVENANSRRISSREDDRIPLVKIKGYQEPLPLKSMGDGMARLFHIIVALVNARDGILLIDEFENGLHWSVQALIWETVFRIASHLNVQVFATTHSRDCIAAFESVWQENEDLGSFFRLEVQQDNVAVTEYSAEDLSDSIETDVEVR